jgi:7-cyano-7-deazaguanine reductase
VDRLDRRSDRRGHLEGQGRGHSAKTRSGREAAPANGRGGERVDRAKLAQFAHLGRRSVLSDEQRADPRSILDAFPNPCPHRDYEIQFVFAEFTSVCPVTGQPDFATIRINYVPDGACVEMKSLKLYFFSFRDKGIFYESVVNTILDDLAAVLKPRRITVSGEFAVRGGTAGTVTASYEAQATPLGLRDARQKRRDKRRQ